MHADAAGPRRGCTLGYVARAPTWRARMQFVPPCAFIAAYMGDGGAGT